jgi:hypothetical protein
MPTGASRLFHTIVVMGAAAGCGSGGRIVPSPLDASGDPADAGAEGAAAADADAAASGPKAICDCVRPGAFRCTGCASGATPIKGRCPASDGTGCTCDESVAIAAPTDCAHPEQFVCAYTADSGATPSGQGFIGSPYDWYAFADCICDEARPITASQCTCAQCSLRCSTPWTCGPGTPGSDSAPEGARYACACLPPIPTIK